MQIVIDIPEDVYKSIQNNDYCGISNPDMYNAIKNGTPLPKGHGDLVTKEQMIELVEFYQLNPQHFDFVNLIDEIKDEKPIVEEVADKIKEYEEKQRGAMNAEQEIVKPYIDKLKENISRIDTYDDIEAEDEFGNTNRTKYVDFYEVMRTIDDLLSGESVLDKICSEVLGIH